MELGYTVGIKIIRVSHTYVITIWFLIVMVLLILSLLSFLISGKTENAGIMSL